jgi:hypothetical protein
VDWSHVSNGLTESEMQSNLHSCFRVGYHESFVVGFGLTQNLNGINQQSST